MEALKEIFNCDGPLLLDGGLGSNFMTRGLEVGEAPESLLLRAPGIVKTLHRDFIAAGAELILTNSFGGNARRLALHGLEGEVGVLNVLAARLAREAASEIGKPQTLIAGSMGPTGDLLEPLGPLSAAEARRVFAEQAKGLADGGVDLLWIETLAAQDEMLAAVDGALTTGLPVALTLSFDSAGKTMMGLGPADFVALADELPLLAYGANCGAGLSDLALVMHDMAVARTSDKALIAKGNCGIPKFVDGEIRYDGTPVLMGIYAQLMQQLEIALIGGCCGTTPEHIAAMRARLDDPSPSAIPGMDRALIEGLLGESSISSPPSRNRRSHRRVL